jgi:aminoglycoside phosphotransferase (APT) family kinase protein
MASPAAEIHVDARLVRALLDEQHPDLADLRLLELDAGWDNTLWRLGDALLVRLPRRALAASLTLNEQRWLPTLSTLLPLPVSAPVRVGRPSRVYPWSWSILPWLEGTPGDRSAITSPAAVATQLGDFLRALHHAAPPTAPSNPFRGVPLVDRADTFETRVNELSAEIDGRAVREVWKRACEAAPWVGPPMWLHGDLHPANTLVADGILSAVIDFGDLCSGDPATDLAAAWMLLPPSELPAFASAYGGMDADLDVRALGWSILFGTMLLAIGLENRPTYEPIGRRTLDHAIMHAADRR